MDSPEEVIKATQTVVSDLMGHYGWMFIAAIAVLLFKNVVSNVLDGLLFMFGHDFDVDDIVYINGDKKARIIRQTPTKTVFHLIETDRKLIVPNTALYSLRIEKILPGSNNDSDN
ncbi:MAG: mechanosensitive ion channel [Candidatus Peribacter sp.]|nr:mechanosensitive ion channel [Candidatus Peribacter sp.]